MNILETNNTICFCVDVDVVIVSKKDVPERQNASFVPKSTHKVLVDDRMFVFVL